MVVTVPAYNNAAAAAAATAVQVARLGLSQTSNVAHRSQLNDVMSPNHPPSVGNNNDQSPFSRLSSPPVQNASSSSGPNTKILSKKTLQSRFNQTPAFTFTLSLTTSSNSNAVSDLAHEVTKRFEELLDGIVESYHGRSATDGGDGEGSGDGEADADADAAECGGGGGEEEDDSKMGTGDVVNGEGNHGNGSNTNSSGAPPL